MSKYFPTGGFKWLDPAKFSLDKDDNNSLRSYVLEVDFKYPKQLHELHNDCSLVSGRIEIKKEILSDYQLKRGDDYDLSISNVKK